MRKEKKLFQKPLDSFDAFDRLLHFINLKEVLGGLMAKQGWFRKGSPEEDEVVSHAAHELIEGVVNADNVSKIDLHTGINLRDQVTVEELEDWDKDRKLRGFGRRN